MDKQCYDQVLNKKAIKNTENHDVNQRLSIHELTVQVSLISLKYWDLALSQPLHCKDDNSIIKRYSHNSFPKQGLMNLEEECLRAS